jgi:hypothetical protein
VSFNTKSMNGLTNADTFFWETGTDKIKDQHQSGSYTHPDDTDQNLTYISHKGKEYVDFKRPVKTSDAD